MTPTDEQLNRRAAEVLGWEWEPFDGFWTVPAGHPEAVNAPDIKLPDFCSDRNALPELLKVIGKTNETRTEYLWQLRLAAGAHSATDAQLWRIEKLTPRQRVIAALKALGAWLDDWE